MNETNEPMQEAVLMSRALYDQARVALIQLRNEIVGTVGLAEAMLRNTVGNTNMAILQEKIKQAERCIAAMEATP